MPNPVGINLKTSTIGFSGEGFALFKNRVREGRGFCGTTANVNDNTPIALSAAGWPAADFSVYLYEGNIRQPWLQPVLGPAQPPVSGMVACGFMTTTGTETVTAFNGGNIANLVRGAIGTYTTFDWWSGTTTGAGAFKVTGTSGTTTNVFAFLPAFRSLAPAAGTSGAIDDPTTAAAFTPDAIAHYAQYAHLRLMVYCGANSNVQVSTSATRRTASNTQANQGFLTVGNGQVPALAFTAAPGNGATSATLTANWPYASGSYGLPIASTHNNSGRIATCTNGSTSVMWSPALTEAATSANLGALGFAGFPIEWAVALCNACNVGIWINTPLLEDGANSSAGSWSSSVMDYLAANWTSTGKIYFEICNEIWNFQFPQAVLSVSLASVYGFSNQTSYMAYLLHAMANLCRTKFPTTFGSKVNLVLGGRAIASAGGLAYINNILTALALLGTPSADVQYTAVAAYVTPTIGNNDSIATILATTTASAVTRALTLSSENIGVLSRHFGIPLCAYESGGQWDVVNSNNANVGKAIMDPGMTAALTTHYQGLFDSGYAFITHYGAGVAGSTGNKSPLDELSNVYTSPLTSPTLSALQKFMGGATPARNVIPGGPISGVNYADNSALLVNSPGTFNLAVSGGGFAPYLVSGYLLYLINCNRAGTYTLTVSFTVTSGNPTTSLEVNGVVLQTGVPVVSGNQSFGSVTLTQGLNYILLGQNGSQAGVAVNSLNFTARVKAVSEGLYNGIFRNVGDVFDVLTSGDLSDSLLPINAPGDPDYPVYGWMLVVPPTTPLVDQTLSTGQGQSSPVQASRGTNTAGQSVLGQDPGGSIGNRYVL
jgi:hypothetical protein